MFFTNLLRLVFYAGGLRQVDRDLDPLANPYQFRLMQTKPDPGLSVVLLGRRADRCA